MKKMSSETKYFMYECILTVVSMIVFFGLIFGGVMIGDWTIHISMWLVIGYVGFTCFVGYWMLALMNDVTSDDSQEEDR